MADKRYYWIKLKAEFFDLDTIDWLISQERGCEYIVLYQKLCLMTANRNGEMSSEVGDMLIPFDEQKISRDTKFEAGVVKSALELFKKLGLIYEQTNGVLKIPYVEEIVGSETDYAAKKREYRERAKEEKRPSYTETMSETMSETLSDKRKSIDKEKDKEINNKEKINKKEAPASDKNISTIKHPKDLSERERTELLEKAFKARNG